MTFVVLKVLKFLTHTQKVGFQHQYEFSPLQKKLIFGLNPQDFQRLQRVLDKFTHQNSEWVILERTQS